MIKTVHYDTREEMVAAVKKSMERKREWLERADRTFSAIRQKQMTVQ